jgi:hypothetical protein
MKNYLRAFNHNRLEFSTVHNVNDNEHTDAFPHNEEDGN